jgi:IS1 family transposase
MHIAPSATKIQGLNVGRKSLMHKGFSASRPPITHLKSINHHFYVDMRDRLRIMASMKKLDPKTRAQVLHLLMEGNSVRGTARLTDTSKTTILKLIEDAGRAAAWYQDRVFQNLNCKLIEADEMWGFCGTKEANVTPEKKAKGEGDCWLWIATDPVSKLVPCWYVGTRSGQAASKFMDDLASRLAGRIQLSTDALFAYGDAVRDAFEEHIDYGQVVKVFGKVPDSFAGRYSPPQCIGMRKQRMEGNPDYKLVSTSHAERNNLNVRMHARRYTRLTNAFSKKIENHKHAMALHFLYYNFVRVHQTLKVSPAMAASITKRLWEMSDVVNMLETWETVQNK